MKAILAAVVGLLLLATSAGAISDLGAPSVTRLWTSTSTGDRFTCTASYIHPYISEYVSWVVTAGHCDGADLLKRNVAGNLLTLVNWRGKLMDHAGRYTTCTVDLLAGTTPDAREVKSRLWLAAKAPSGGIVYIHGFPRGVERVTAGQLIAESDSEFPCSRVVRVTRGEIAGGSSGSPILDSSGSVVGIVWGLREGTPYDEVLMTPVEVLHALLNLLNVRKPGG